MNNLLKALCYGLPYKLKVQWKRTEDGELITQDLTISDYPFLIKRKYAKPILFPLEALTDVIEINGYYKFIPMDELKVICDGSVHEEDYLEHLNDFKDKLHETDIMQMPLRFVEALLSWHFNIFGLKEDQFINALDNNPYK